MIRLCGWLAFVVAAVFFAILVFWGSTSTTDLAADGWLCLAIGFVLVNLPVAVENGTVRRVP